MLTKILTLAVTAVALAAPPAAAGHVQADCGYDTVEQGPQGGDMTHTGLAYAYVVSPVPGEAVSIRCYVAVNGVEVATGSTPTGTGTTAAHTYGEVTYTVRDTDWVSFCIAWTAGSERGGYCLEPDPMQIPPQETVDLVDDILRQVEDLLIWIGPTADQHVCELLPMLSPGVPGVVDIDSEGDVDIAGVPFWDCPPYDWT